MSAEEIAKALTIGLALGLFVSLIVIPALMALRVLDAQCWSYGVC